MTARELPKEALERSAVVYVRQSTGIQVQENLESQRRQYELVEVARRYGFRDVKVIDEDLCRFASGTMDRPGFRNLVGLIGEGTVGAVLCLEASRLARNGRDWHHLLELCGLVGAYVVDSDGAHDPASPNDRLLLGLKGTMSEFELTLIRKRLTDAAVAKAHRGELRIGVPVGYRWSREWPGLLYAIGTVARQLTARGTALARPSLTPRCVSDHEGIRQRGGRGASLVSPAHGCDGERVNSECADTYHLAMHGP